MSENKQNPHKTTHPVILQFGSTPTVIANSIVKNIGNIVNIAVSVEWKNGTNSIAFNDCQNGYEVIGRLHAIQQHIRDRMIEDGQ